MVNCSIISCKNSSRTCNSTNKGITFHRFPKDPDIKEKWINITGRQDWFPTENSRICSVHFQEEDFNVTAKRRNLLQSSIPTLNIWKLCSENSTANTPSTSALPVTSTLPSTSSGKHVSPLPSSNHSENRPSIDLETPREKKLRRIIETNKGLITRQRLMIKRLQCRFRRYEKKNLELKYMLENLENKRLITGEQALSLENMNLSTQDLNGRHNPTLQLGKIRVLNFQRI